MRQQKQLKHKQSIETKTKSGSEELCDSEERKTEKEWTQKI